ncbi:hypothetical protein [Streptomyces sp. JH34]|uniref:hypothetical protein n=1 Tax=Streptomyces sp. JH34 TaxID=2793633 RepID=UPI0023F8F0F5|nr:hypothetical protein [Streptomyces sp. JH34]MDF6018892.1 hypothetical protein [Streptomyces sp. JH34]
MSVRGSLRRHRFIGAAVSVSATLVLASGLSACSGDSDDAAGKKYTVPASLCGVAVDPALVKALLPNGDSVSSASSKPNGGTARCDVSVDGEVALRLTQAWWGAGESATTVAQGYADADEGTASDDGRFVHAGKAAVGKTASCTSSEHPDQDLYAVVQVLAPGIDDKAAMKSLITDYTEAVGRSDACR